jgi:hypothetical protein
MKSASEHLASDLLIAFARALTHKIRTPLSVLSNDLFYFRSVLDAEEVEGSLVKAQSIADLLTSLSRFDRSSEQEHFNISELLLEFGPLPPCMRTGDREEFRLLIATIPEALREAGIVDIRPSIQDSGTTISLIYTCSLTASLKALPQLSQYCSLTELLFYGMGCDATLAPFIDALMLKYQAQISIHRANVVTITFSFES